MTLSEISIRRPVFAWMLMLGLIIFGAISFRNLGVSQMPDVDFPVLAVSVTWEGAAPEVVESEIVDRLESTIISIEGIREITSNIRQGRATISVEFDLKRNIDAALQELQSAISRVRLPLEVDTPTITKSNPDDQPIIWVGFGGDRSLADIVRYVDLNIRDQFQILPGVGEIVLGGFTERSLRVWVDNKQLSQYELTILDIQQALQTGQTEVAAGIIENNAQEMNVRMMGEGITPEQVGEILITQRGGRPIYNSTLQLKDVARIEDGLDDIRRVSRISGTPGVGLGIKKQRGSNAVEVGDRVKALVAEIEKTLPPDLKIQVNFDSTVFVRESIEETEFTLILSALATGVVCFLFLGSLRPTLNILLSIPTSIVGTFMIIDYFGFTLNLFTLLGLALAIGIVVDDAIMVLENIYRHKDMGKSREQAARDGGSEITFAAVAATVAVIAIFLPVAFMKGIIGKFFFQFGITISGAVLLSLLEALTLTPMRLSQFMEERRNTGFAALLDRIFSGLARGYQALLRIALKGRYLVLIAAVLIFASSLTLLSSLKRELIPPQDQSVFIVRFQTPIGSSLEYTSQKLLEAEAFMKSRPEVLRYFAAVGGFGGGEVNTGLIFVTMKPRKERSVTQLEFMNLCRAELVKIKDLKPVMQDLSTRGFTAQRGFPIEFNIRGPSWSKLQELSEQVVAEYQKSGFAVDIDTDYRLGQPEVRVWPLRDEAAKRGVEVDDIAHTVSAAIGGVEQGKFSKDGRRYDVRLRLRADDRLQADDAQKLMVRNIHGELVPIKDVIRIEKVPTLQTITRRNRERSISIFANVAPGQSQAAALDAAREISERILPEGYHFYLGSGAQTFIESFASLKFVLWLGLVVAYMVLASQFNSFIHPVTVLLALPFSITGALWALSYTGQSLNLYSFIGIVLLMGIVKKNSILLVEFANNKREEGLPAREAMIEAAGVRLRPILMTTFSTLAAALPPALALGPGAESRIPMSVAILGGVLVSTMFTLYVVPCAYTIFSRFERHKHLDLN